jgi:hypothetical protein
VQGPHHKWKLFFFPQGSLESIVHVRIDTTAVVYILESIIKARQQRKGEEKDKKGNGWWFPNWKYI